MPPPRVLFYVQHLLGIGHLKRAALICRALAEAGLDTTLVSGGLPLSGLDLGGARLAQLPPLRSADLRFSALLDETGTPVDDAWKASRRDRLLKLFDELRPEVLIVEMYPFGRRQMRFELLPLLEAARAAEPRPLVFSSLRDILAKAPTAERAAWIADQLARNFDGVLVHADPAFVTLGASFPEATAFADKLLYTGFVAPAAQEPPIPESARQGVVVSAGGGAVGTALIEAAIAARPLSRFSAAPWTVLTGPNFPAARLAALEQEQNAGGATGLTLAPSHPRFLALLARAELSISQGGYNTVMDLLRVGTKAILVPFAAEGEAEQTLRATLLEKAGLAVMLAESELSPANLAAAIDRAADQVPGDFPSETPQQSLPDLEGAAGTAARIRQALEARAGT